jgi:hypothetical protein
MPAIIEWPTGVQEALARYGDLFKNEPERRHFAEYLTGLLIAERKTVSGINAEFALTTDQSCLNRWINEVAWDVQALNERRLAELQKDSSTRYSDRGVIAVDNTLIDHEGKLIEDVGWFWDHAEQRNKIAHDYLIANYVCSSGKHYALEFRRFRKREDCSEGEPFQDHTELFKELADWVIEHQIPGAFAFDSYFTNAPIMNHLNTQRRAYVGDLKTNRKVVFLGKEMRVDEVARSIPAQDRKPIQIGDKKQWHFTRSVRLPKVDHPVRILILWENREDSEVRKILVTNRTQWEAIRMLLVYRHRWTGTESFHRDGKQHLGMGDCQLRNGQGQTRHLYMVILAHSLLVSQMRQDRAKEWAVVTLATIGEACRAVMRETLQRTITWAIERATLEGWTSPRICHVLNIA